MVQMEWLVLKLKMSQVTDVAEKEIQEPKSDKVMTSEPELSLFVECSLLRNIQNFCLLR